MHRAPPRQAMQTDFWWRSDCDADVQSMCNILAAEREREICAESMYCGLIVSMQSSHLYIPVFLSLCKATISQAQSQLASAMGRQNRSRHDPIEFLSRRIHEQALQAATEPDKKTTKEDYSLLDLPEVIVGDLYLGLPCTDALALGSTCRTLQQLLQPLRFAKIEQYLKSGDLAPLVQKRVVDRRSASLGVGYTNLYFSWTVRASRILYHLVTKEKFPPDVLWAAIVHVPQVPISERHKWFFSICCRFGCLDWVCGSMQCNGSQTLLYQRLAHSDLARLDATFSGLRDSFFSRGMTNNLFGVFIHLRKTEPDFTQQQDATLVVYWDSDVHNNYVLKAILDVNMSRNVPT